MTRGYDDRCPYCRERAAIDVQYKSDTGPCPRHAVHWVGDAPTSLHGNGASSLERTTRNGAEVTCKLCLALLEREPNHTDRSTT